MKWAAVVDAKRAISCYAPVFDVRRRPLLAHQPCWPQGCGWGRRRASLAPSTGGIEGRSAQRTSEGAIFAMARPALIAQIDP